MELAGLLPIVALGGLMYVMMIRPQQRRMREHRFIVSSLQLEDDVITAGGIFGRIVQLGDEAITVELVDGARMKVLRNAISRKVSPDGPEDAADTVDSAGGDD